MARIIALDTTSALGSIALIEDGDLIEEITMHSPDGFSPVLFGKLEELLTRHQIPLQSIDCFAGAIGPGSFTGVRVCLTAIKGLAESCDKPVIGVSNLAAVASFGSSPQRAPWIDARRGEIYGGVYSEDLALLSEERVLPMDQWKSEIPASAEVIPGDGKPLAAAIGRIAHRLFLNGNRMDPAGLDANYVRRSDAELFWTEVV